MSHTSSHQSLRDQARALREQKEADALKRRTEHERLNRLQDALETLSDAVKAMRRALDPLNSPPSATELEAHCHRITPLLAAALAALRETGRLRKLAELDETATLAYYRQKGDDPREIKIVYRYARQIIEADPDDCQRLSQLVQGAMEERGLRGAWTWVSILLHGLAGNQWLEWKEAERTPPSDTPSWLASEGSRALSPAATGPATASGTSGKPAARDTSHANDPALSQRQYNILETLKLLGALSAASRETTHAIAVKAEAATGCSATFKQAVAGLAGLGLVGTKAGRGGGVWLTANGLALIDGILSKRSQKR